MVKEKLLKEILIRQHFLDHFNVEKVISLGSVQKRCRAHQIMQFPPHNVAGGVLSTVFVRVARRSKLVGLRWRVVNATDAGGTGYQTAAEFAVLSIILAAETRKIRRGTRDTQGTRIGAIASPIVVYGYCNEGFRRRSRLKCCRHVRCRRLQRRNKGSCGCGNEAWQRSRYERWFHNRLHNSRH